MESDDKRAEKRERSAGLRPLFDEVPRQRLVDLLAGRWRTSVTTIEAPAGFGKSVAVSQAIRDNALDPSGVDLYVALRRTDRDAKRFAATIFRELECGIDAELISPDDLADQICIQVAVSSPMRVALIIDDVHHLRTEDSSLSVLAGVIRQLPTNGRLVLSGRSIPPLPLQRLAVADDLERVTAEDLVFNDDEILRLAAMHHVDHRTLRGADGWPALTRLAITVGSVASMEYLLEEVASALDQPQKRAVAATVIGKRLPVVALRKIVGTDSIGRLLQHVPLISVHDGEVVSAHDLWGDVLPLLLSPEETSEIAGDVATWFLAARQFDDAIDVGTAFGAFGPAIEAAVAVVTGGEAFPTAQHASAKLARFPVAMHDLPELRLLRSHATRLSNGPSSGVEDAEVALQVFLESGDPQRIQAAAFQVGYLAWLEGDVARALQIVELGRSMKPVEGSLLHQLLVAADSLIADLSAQPARALELLETVDGGVLPVALWTTVLRQRISLRQQLGDDTGAVTDAALLEAQGSHEQLQFSVALSHWFAGLPHTALAKWSTLRHQRVDNTHDSFLVAVYSTFIDSCLGLQRDRTGLDNYQSTRKREEAFRALATGAGLVAEGNEVAAQQIIGGLLEGNAADPTVVGECRRFFALSWVLAPQIHTEMVSGSLGPRQLRQQRLAEQLVQLREAGSQAATSDVGDAAESSDLLCSFPLRWSTEYIARFALVDPNVAVRRALALLEPTEGRARALFAEYSSQSCDVALADGAKAVLMALPANPIGELFIRVIGPMTVETEPVPDGSLLRRTKVRELLALLVIQDRVSATEVLRSLWPDLDFGAARNNLRITLTFLRRLLEPSRPTGDPSFYVCRDSTHLWLRRSPELRCDLWEVQASFVAADRADRARDSRRAIGHLHDALRHWRGDPLRDIGDFDSAIATVTGLELQLSRAAARCAEWSLALGELSDATDLAGRLLETDPYNEQAHAVLMSAHLQNGAPGAAKTAAEACSAALHELRVVPNEVTAMVLKQVEEMLGATGEVNERRARQWSSGR